MKKSRLFLVALLAAFIANVSISLVHMHNNQAQIAYADDAATAPAPAPATVDPTTAPDDAVAKVESNPTGFVADLYNAARNGNVLLAFGLGLVGLVWVARRIGAKYIAWFKTDRGGLTLTALTIVVATFGLAIVGGMPLNGTLLTLMIQAVTTAIGLYVGGRKTVIPSA